MGNRYVSFLIGDNRFCAPIEQVLQILRHENLQEIPKAPPFVEGVLNLRGDIIPVVSLRERLGLPGLAAKAVEAKKRRIILAQAGGRRYGLSVDEVREIIDIPATAVQEEAASALGVRAEFVLGFAKVGDTLLLILDISRVLSPGGNP
jgi:purine-binding chemotaxis protein CheW